MRRCSLSLVAALTLSGAGFAEERSAGDHAEAVTRLVAQLGHKAFRLREAAAKQLEAIGEPALDALRSAAKSRDPEVAERARSLAERIQARLENARRIRPTLVDLKLDNAPVERAVAELASQAGFPITVGGDLSKLRDRRVTLVTGSVPFWEALAQLCEKAGLAESDVAAGPVASAVPAPRPPMPPVAPVGPVPPPAVPARLMVVRSSVGNAAPVRTRGIALGDGPADRLPTHVQGAMRVRAAAGRADGQVPAGEPGLTLQVHAEPRLAIERVLGVTLDRAVDNRGQELTPVTASAAPSVTYVDVNRLNNLRGGPIAARTPAAAQLQGTAAVRFKKGDRPSAALREVSGRVTVQLRSAAEELAVIENPSEVKPNTVARGDGNVQLKLINFQKLDTGEYAATVEVQHPNDVTPGMPTRQGVGLVRSSSHLGFVLSDGEGAFFGLGSVRTSRMMMQGWGRTVLATLHFRKEPGQGEPVRLAFQGTRPVPVEVSFTLRDVPLK